MKEFEIEYHVNGQIKREIPFVDGKPHGVAKWSYENGNVMYEIPIVDGKRHGVAKEYDENGNLIKETLYENGELKKESLNIGVSNVGN